MKNLVQEGDRVTWTNGTGSDVASGQPVTVNGRTAVACVDIANGASGALATEGVFQLAKETGKTFAQFDDVYWDAVAKKVTSDKDLGAATGAAVAGGTGNGTITAAPTVGAAAKSGVYRLTCIAVATDGGKFQVEDPDGIVIGTAVVGVQFATHLTFTIADGSTDFVAGDAFTITVAAGSNKIGYAHKAAATGDTTADVYVNAAVKL
jgi:predicted RecA/RadA family phage recombinase